MVSYAEELLGAWEQRPAAQLTTDFGVSLAVGVVRTLGGLSESGCRLEGPQGGEPLWRRLKWGMTIAARALDVSAAPGNFSQSFKEEDLVSKSGFGALLLLTYECACRRVREVALDGYTLSPRFHTSWTAFFRMLLFLLSHRNRRIGADDGCKVQAGACGRSVNTCVQAESRVRRGTQKHGKSEAPVRAGVFSLGRMTHVSTACHLAVLEQSSIACYIAANQAGQLSITFCRRPIVLVQLKLRTFGKSIEIDLSVMRPARGLKIVVGLVVESISSAGDARTEVNKSVHSFR